MGAERASVVLDDAKRATRTDDDAPVAEALDVRNNLTTIDGDFAHRRALAHQSQRACALLDQSTEAAINTAGEVTVAVSVLQDRQRRARSDVDDGTSTRAGDPHVGRNFAPEGLEVTNRLIRGDTELRGAATR